MKFDVVKNTKVIFMGTPKIATYALKALKNRGYEILAVITQPDRIAGRKKTFTFSPIKQLAMKLDIKLFQPNNLYEIKNELVKLKPDLFFTCAFGQFIPDSILSIPKYGCINAHGSILPKYRGGAPIHWALINGEKSTGFTLMKTIKKMDAGDTYIAYSITIDEYDNLKTLTSKMEKVVYLLTYNELENVLNGSLKPIKQNENEATFGFNIKPEHEKININANSQKILNLIKGLYENPCAYLIYDSLKVKVYTAKVSDNISIAIPGTIVGISDKGIEVATLDFNIYLTEIQLEGKKRTKVKEFILGNKLFKIGGIFV